MKASELRKLFKAKPIVRIVGAHNALGAQLIERNQFDAVWASGFEISTAHGVPDANILTMTENLQVAQNMNEATKLPVVCDCDTGYGNASNVIHMIKKYEAADLAAAVIEDKRFPKVNSFIPGRQELAPVAEFAGKIEAAKNAQQSQDFMVFARIEAFIAGWGLDEMLKRADAYAAAGADGLVIHSKAKTPDEIYSFAEKWKGSIPLVAIPTTYSSVTGEELAKHGFKMVIYANHGLRAAIQAMNETFQSISEAGSTAPVEDRIVPMKHVFELQGMGDMKEREKKFLRKEPLRAIIPAASAHQAQSDLAPLLKDRPLCMLDLAGKTLLDRQMDLLRSSGVTDISVIGGYLLDQIKAESAEVIPNPEFESRHSAHSIMCAREQFKGKVIMLYSDILFDRAVVDQLLESPHDITLVIDRAYQSLPTRSKKLDLVFASEAKQAKSPRSLDLDLYKPICKIGKQVPQQEANYEFIGIAFFRSKGSKEIVRAWTQALKEKKSGNFYEAQSADQAGFTDLIQYMIDQKMPVHGMEINHGWSEVHARDDYDRINAYFQNTSAPKSTLS